METYVVHPLSPTELPPKSELLASLQRRASNQMRFVTVALGMRGFIEKTSEEDRLALVNDAVNVYYLLEPFAETMLLDGGATSAEQEAFIKGLFARLETLRNTCTRLRINALPWDRHEGLLLRAMGLHPDTGGN